MDLAVIVCTHNPRTNYLTQTLEALKAQTLPVEQWGLLLVDNVSDDPLQGRWDLSFQPRARIVREDELGLTHARLRGIRETNGELIVFVDDDNVLDPDYLEQVLSISEKWPMLGAWGGQIRGSFEVEPPDWTREYLGNLAIREFDSDRWSNLLHQLETTPFGAGLVIRRQVAEAYRQTVSSDPNRARLDRTGSNLHSFGDIDIAFTAVDIGLGMGLFTALKVTHLIPPERLSEEYFIELLEKGSYSRAILDSFRGRFFSPPPRSLLTRIHEWGHRLRMDGRSRRLELAGRRGLETAHKVLQLNGRH